MSANGFTASSTSGTFSLVNGSVTVTSPNTAVAWTIGTVHAITWTHNAGAGAQFKIEVSRSGVWSTDHLGGDGRGRDVGQLHLDGRRAEVDQRAKVRVTWNANTAAQDSSNVSFTISEEATLPGPLETEPRPKKHSPARPRVSTPSRRRLAGERSA